jgi:hypothetical protein
MVTFLTFVLWSFPDFIDMITLEVRFWWFQNETGGTIIRPSVSAEFQTWWPQVLLLDAGVGFSLVASRILLIFSNFISWKCALIWFGREG